MKTTVTYEQVQEYIAHLRTTVSQISTDKHGKVVTHFLLCELGVRPTHDGDRADTYFRPRVPLDEMQHVQITEIWSLFEDLRCYLSRYVWDLEANEFRRQHQIATK